MIILSAELFDAAYSPLLLNEDPRASTLRNTERRVSRTALLDGAVAIDDAGFSDGDRTMSAVVIAPSREQIDAIQQMMQTMTFQRLATVDGIFHGVIDRVSAQRGEININFLVKTKLNA